MKTKSSNLSNYKSNKYPLLNLSSLPRLVVSEELKYQIDLMHNRFPGLEWSGILLYTIDGSITDLDNATITAHKFFPLDIGTSAYTEFNYDEKIMQMYDMWEDALEMQVGLIHTHHTMSAFFSGTDDSELHDNVAKHNYYLSLIVSQTSEYCAKVASLVDLHINRISVRNEDGKMDKMSVDNVSMPQYMAVAECDIQMPETEELEENPYLRWINELNEERKKKQKSKTYNYKGSNYTTYGSTYQGNNNQDYYGQGQLPLKSKSDSKEFKFNELPVHTKNSLFAKMLALDVQCKDTLSKVIADINKAAKKNKDMSKKEYLESHAFAIFEYAPTIAESFLGVPINLTGEGTLMYEFANELSKRKDSEGIVSEVIKQMEIPNEQ